MVEDETFEQFKNSFSYGSRTDLSFKFLKGMSNEEAAAFLAELLHEVGELFDEPSSERLVDLVYERQVQAYAPRPGSNRPYVYDDGPFTRPAKLLSEARLALVTSSGHFVSDDPASVGRSGVTQEEVVSQIDEYLREPPALSEIPRDSALEGIEVRHPGYDIRSTVRDTEVTLPIRALVEAESEGIIGELAPMAYSFVGACSQLRLRHEVDAWVRQWRSAGIEALFLVPV